VGRWASCGMQRSAAEPSELITDDDDYGYGPDTSGAQESISYLVTGKAQSRLRPCITWVTQTRNFLAVLGS